jgi:ornithine cyclodeaminase/alanine dehydrogenase-like protein (mu-crystallin family)
LVALTDGVFLTAIRTGAASAVATRVLALPTSSTLGLVGAGAQSVTQAHAISRVMPITDIVVYDVDPDAAGSAARRLAFIDADVRPVALEELERTADIISTATTVAPGGGPVIKGAGLKEHVHINAVGSDLPGKTELPLSFLRQALVCPDFHEQAQREGECQRLTEDEIGPELAAIVAGADEYDRYRSSWTVFDSTGIGLEDHVALNVLIRLANENGLGRPVRLEHVPLDPRNPYPATSEMRIPPHNPDIATVALAHP